MASPIPNLQFQPYNPMDTAIKTALGVYSAGMQGRNQNTENQMNQMKLNNPALMAGGDAASIWGLYSMLGMNPYGNRGQEQEGGMTQAPSPYGGSQPSQNQMYQGDVGVEPMGNGPTNFSTPGMGQNPNMGMQNPNQMGQQRPPMNPGMNNQPGMNPNNINELIKFKLMDPASQQAMIAGAQAQAQFPYQQALAKMGVQNQMGVKQFDTSNDLLKNSSNVSQSALKASADINHFEDAMKKISPLLNAPIIGGLTSQDAKMQSKAYREASQAANSLVLNWAPVMTQNGILQDSTLKMVQDSKLNPDSPREVNDSVISIMRPAAARMQEQNPFMKYAMKDKNIDPQTAENMWLEYNTVMPIDPFMPGSSEENLGQYKQFINRHLSGEPMKQKLPGMKPKMGNAEMDNKIQGALNVDPALMQEMKDRGLIK